MKNLEDRQIQFIKLIQRSPDRGGGWRTVSGVLRDLAITTVAKQPELYETKEDGDAFMLRLSERGAILGAYI